MDMYLSISYGFFSRNYSKGASSDLKQATSIAHHMIRDWGMSEKVGLRTFDAPHGFEPPENLGPNTSEMVR